jgi:hypothetical protein
MEGPESGVYYKGEGYIPSGKRKVKISLPDYVNKLATEFSVILTCIGRPVSLSSSPVKDNKFTVKTSRKHISSDITFFWVVYGKRENVYTEPLKTDIIVKGDGPYKYLKC